VIGRERSAQDSWDDACTASVPFSRPGWNQIEKMVRTSAGLNPNNFIRSKPNV